MQNSFCNAAWYELHIYWDGQYGYCCQSNSRPVTDTPAKYNVKTMSIKEWFNSDLQRKFRLSLFNGTLPKSCGTCLKAEQYSSTSRRHRANQKSVIFTKQNFSESYAQSPGFAKFEQSRLNDGDYGGMPIDLHIDLSNACNLTCKMCTPEDSSSIAKQYVKWGITSAAKLVNTDWTKDEDVWNRIVEEIANTPKLSNVHFMGGETLITSRFEDFVDYMIEKERFDLNFSFVTNGTLYNQQLMDKLKKFGRIGIEVSIETVTPHNAYQRQGTNTSKVIQNIEKYIEFGDQSNNSVTIRPAISALSIGNYYTLLEFCFDKKLLIKALAVINPAYLNINVLPKTVRESYASQYQNLLVKLNLQGLDADSEYNESDPHNFNKNIKNQIDWCINLLAADPPENVNELRKELVANCSKWDQVHQYNALDLYPELADLFIKHNYAPTKG